MVTISLCMIVRDEEDVLKRCLDSAAGLVDEIILVDTGSTDRTKEIAAQFTDHIYDFAWIDDFAAARNYAFSKASSMYCMWLDADDVILEHDRKAFLALKSEITTDTNVVMMKYNTGFDQKGNVTFSYFRERIIKNNMGMLWKGAVHEVIEAVGKTIHSQCAITHQKLHPSDPDRNLRIFEKLLENGIPLDPRQQFYYGRELYYHKRYEDAIRIFETFLDEDAGWVENKIDACIHCFYCYNGLHREMEGKQALLRSFLYDLPRAEICCYLGGCFFEQAQYSLAVYWYQCALTCKRDDSRGGFVSPDAYGYTPCIQLCVCFSRMGETEKAIEYNEKAADYKPDAEAVSLNRTYFSKISQQK